MRRKRSGLAEESLKTKKTRERLKKRLEALDKKVTEQALESKVLEMHRWLERHSEQRVALQSKNMSLFDGNQNAATISQKVSVLADQIRKEILTAQEKNAKDLEPILKKMVSTPFVESKA